MKTITAGMLKMKFDDEEMRLIHGVCPELSDSNNPDSEDTLRGLCQIKRQCGLKNI